MRELKFRAYNPTTKNMWWFDLRWGNTYCQGSGWIGMLPIGEDRSYKGFSDNRIQVDPDDCEIMQFTGLKDKNGKDIFEGDIVNHELWGKAIVKFGDGANMGGGDSSSYFYGYYLDFAPKEGQSAEAILESAQINIIGNIYQNPELLEKK